MFSKKITLALLTASMAIGASAAQAQPFSTLGAIPATPMSAEQMKAVEGKAHIYDLVELKTGKIITGDLEATLRAAAPANKNFTPSPSAKATAFDFRRN